MKINLFCWLVIFILVFAFRAKCFLDEKIIKGYFQEKFIRQASIITCYNKKDQVKFAKSMLDQKNIMISFSNMENVEIEDFLTVKTHRLGVILDTDCLHVSYFLEKCSDRHIFDAKHNWLLLSSTQNYTNLLSDLNISIDSDIQVVYPNLDIPENVNVQENSKNHTVEDVYNPAYGKGGTLQRSSLGFYNEEDGYKAREKRNRFFVRRNLTGVIFKSVVVLPVPFDGSLDQYLRSDDDRNINTFNRFHARLMCFCKDYYNYSVDIEVEKSWGYLNPDGTMDGMVGKLSDHTIDFGMSPLFVKTERAKFMLYGRRTWTLRAAFIFKNPKSRRSFEIFIKPLSESVWLLIVISAAMSSFLLKFSYSYEQRKLRKNNGTSSYSYIVLCIFGAFCQQGFTSTPKFLCGRITTIFTFMLSVIIFQFYSASLVSFLLNVPSTPLTTLEDLLHSDLKGGCEDILYDKDYFKYTTDNTTKKLYKKWISPNDRGTNYFNPKDGLPLVQKGQYAFHVELATAYPIIQDTFDERSICDLREIPMMPIKPMHANYQKKSPFRDIMDTCLHRFAENGVLDRELKFWHPKKPECVRSPKTIVINTGLPDFYPALVVLAVGIILSLHIMAAEIFWKYRNNRLANENSIIYPFVR